MYNVYIVQCVLNPISTETIAGRMSMGAFPSPVIRSGSNPAMAKGDGKSKGYGKARDLPAFVMAVMEKSIENPCRFGS